LTIFSRFGFLRCFFLSLAPGSFLLPERFLRLF